MRDLQAHCWEEEEQARHAAQKLTHPVCFPRRCPTLATLTGNLIPSVVSAHCNSYGCPPNTCSFVISYAFCLTIFHTVSCLVFTANHDVEVTYSIVLAIVHQANLSRDLSSPADYCFMLQVPFHNACLNTAWSKGHKQSSECGS